MNLLEDEPEDPEEAEEDVLGHGEVVVGGARVDRLLPQQPVLPRVGGEEAPVHLEVPGERVEGRDDLGEQKKPVEHLEDGKNPRRGGKRT